MDVVLHILALSMEVRQRRWGEETPSCCPRSAAWGEEERVWKPEPLREGQQVKPKAGGGPEAARRSAANAVCPVPAASPSCSLALAPGSEGT